jgi:hypothetical protein
MNKKTFVIWFKDGTTAMFNDVDKVKYGDRVIEFDYDGKSTGKRMSALFYRDSMRGFSESID